MSDGTWTTTGYLGLAALGLGAAALILLLVPPLRRPTALAGLFAVPLAPLGIPSQGVYWSPPRLAGGVFGIEDILFSAGAGCMAWMLPVWLVERTNAFRVRLRARPRYARLALAGPCGALVYLIGLRFDPDPMTFTVALQTLMAAVMLLLLPRLWPLALWGSLTYVLFYLVQLHLACALWPGLPDAWNGHSAWFAPVLGVPHGEIAWSATFGAVWPLYFGYVFDAAVRPPRSDSIRRVRPATPGLSDADGL